MKLSSKKIMSILFVLCIIAFVYFSFEYLNKINEVEETINPPSEDTQGEEHTDSDVAEDDESENDESENLEDVSENLHVFELYADDGEPLVNVNVAYPDIDNENITAYYEQIWAETEMHINDILFEQAKEAYEMVENSDFVALPFKYEESYKITEENDKFISIIRQSHTFSGGAHGMTYDLSETFLTDSGAMLLLNDAFTVSEEEYLEIIFAEVLSQVNEKPEDYFEADIEDLIKNTFDKSDFYFTENGLNVFYQSYTIAPGVIGNPHFEIPFALIENIMSDLIK